MTNCDLLQHIPPFSTLDPGTRNKIESLFQLRSFPEGTLLLQENQEITRIGYVVSGHLSVERCSEEGFSRPSGSLAVGEYYGLMALVGKGRSIVDMVAAEPTTCYTIDKVDFVEMLETYPEIKVFFENIALSRIGSFYFKTHSPPVAGPEPSMSKGRKKLQPSLEYMSSNYMFPITLDDVAAINGLSRYHYSRLFKKTVGCSFKEYLNLSRIKAAKRMMGNQNKNVSQICFAVGFNDVSYFARVFKKIEGTSPSVYRKSLLAKKRSVPVGVEEVPDFCLNSLHWNIDGCGQAAQISLAV
ncbi:MAG: helix-turn-helix domain-containing protein [Desulfobacteraceae bacterium]|nr:helix-turn-helix domain-containing protein [Desulfobacteraceae bacterium]